MRNSTTHLGRTKKNLTDFRTGLVLPNAYLQIVKLELLSWRLGWEWGVWNSPEDFENDKQPIGDLKKPFWIEGSNLMPFNKENGSLLAEIGQRLREICLPKNEASFVSARFDTTNYKIEVDFEGFETPFSLVGEQYHSTIANNMDLIAFNGNTPKLIPILHAVSEQKDSAFFVDSVLILPNVG